MPIDPETKAELDKLAAAITAEALGKVIGAALTAHLPTHLKGINDEITALKAAKPDAKAEEEAAREAANKAGKGKEADPRIAQLEARLAASDKAAADAAIAAKNAALSSAARDALIKHGVPADRVAHAMAFVNMQGLLTHDGDRPGWKGKDQYGADAVLDLDAAAKAFVGSADGKVYMPPLNAGGTGGGVGNANAAQRNGTTTIDALRKTGGGVNIGALLGG